MEELKDFNRKLYFRMAWELAKTQTFSAQGVTFTKWLPDGEKDKISIKLDNDSSIELFFKRFGVKQHSEIVYEYGAILDVDDSELSAQSVLIAGALFINYEVITNDEKIVALKLENDESTDELENFLRPITKNVSDVLNKLLNILRSHYGQNWIIEIPHYDKDSCPVGFLYSLQCSTSLDKSVWHRLPTSKKTSEIWGIVPDKSEYERLLTKKRWYELPDLIMDKKVEYFIYHEFFTKACNENSERNYDFATVLAATSLETYYFELRKSGLVKDLPVYKKEIPEYLEKNYSVDPFIIKKIKELVDLRNKLVHEGNHIVVPINSYLENLSLFFSLFRVSSLECNLLERNLGNLIEY